MRRLLKSFMAVAACIAAIAGPGSFAAGVGVQHWDVGRGSVIDDLLANGGSARITYVSGVAGSNTEFASDVGCIEIVTPQGTDRGCGSVPSGGSVDETLNSGSLSFTVPSSVYPNGTLTVNVTLAAFGSYSLDRPLAIDPGARPTIEAAARIVRLAVPSGGVSSSTVGGDLLRGDGGLLFAGSSIVMTAEA